MTTERFGPRILSLAVTSTLLLGGCGGSDTAKESIELMGKRNTTVTAEVLKTGSYSVYLSQPGTTYAIRNVDLESRVTGYIESIDFEDGQLVREGDRLFQIDPRPFEAALLQAQGSLEAAIAQRNLAERTVQRNRPLVESGAISRETFDTYVTDLEQSEGNVETAAGDLINAELNLSFTGITAPFDGRLGQRNFEVGALIGGSADQNLVTIVQYHPMRMLVAVAAENLPLLRQLYTKDEIRADLRVNGTRGGGGRAFQGVVDFIDNQVQPSTSTVMVRVRFPNPDGWAYPGQFGEAKLLVRTIPDAIVIPQRSVFLQQGGKQYVWLIDEKGAVSNQVVEVGDTDDGKVWISKGLKAGQKIVIDTAGQLEAGDTVTIVSADKFAKDKDAYGGGSSMSKGSRSSMTDREDDESRSGKDPAPEKSSDAKAD